MAARKKPTQKPDPREDDVPQDFWRTVKRAAGKVPFLDEVVAGYYCALDEKPPWRVKGILIGALAYFVLPADAIPDLLLGIGFTDDIAVLTAAITSVNAHIKPAHRAAAKRALSEG